MERQSAIFFITLFYCPLSFDHWIILGQRFLEETCKREEQVAGASERYPIN